jgi:mannose-6-phosphate isomerase-like protein (cupin superfamily)
VLRREPMLSSRVFIWQHFTRLTPDEVQQVIPLFHPVWADADPDDIAFADSHAAHGNFRAWAQLTAHTRTALTRTAGSSVWQVFDGTAVVAVGDERYEVNPGDLFCVPSWAGVAFDSDAGLDAFRFSDDPVFEALGLARTAREDTW